MTILGFDTSMAVTAACVLRHDGRAFSTAPPPPERLLGRPEHSAELLPVLATLLEQAEIDWPDVERLAVGVGPGTFTGLRIGVSTARGLAHALGIRVSPVPSLAALAAGLEDVAGERPMLPLIDARRHQVFAALYRQRPSGDSEWGPLALGREELLNRIAGLDPAPLAAGDWALESRPDLEAAGVIVPSADSGLHAVNALHVCRLAEAIEPVPPDGVKPTYVRLPDAEINRHTGGTAGTRGRTRGTAS
jgi:tRNA threonylcarbamoyladenosine biosynthesis protein TsaB